MSQELKQRPWWNYACRFTFRGLLSPLPGPSAQARGSTARKGWALPHQPLTPVKTHWFTRLDFGAIITLFCCVRSIWGK